MTNRTAFPLLDAWLARLPQGLESYPDHQQKASIYRNFLEHTDVPEDVVERLPAPLQELVRDPVPASVWIPEVHGMALFLAVGEAIHPDEQDHRAHWHRLNRELLSGRLYRALMAVASPSLVLRATDARWGALHRGIALSVEARQEGVTRATLSYPDHLLPERIAGDFAVGFQAALEGAGARDVDASMTGWGRRESRNELRWR